MNRQNGFCREPSMIPRSIFALFCSIALAASADVSRAVDVVAVCPEPFRQTLQPWIDHRREGGLNVCTIDTADTAKSLAAEIAKAADEKTRYVLLVGDAPVIGTRCDRSRQVPTTYSRTQVTAKWGSPPTLSSDMPHGRLGQRRSSRCGRRSLAGTTCQRPQEAD